MTGWQTRTTPKVLPFDVPPQQQQQLEELGFLVNSHGAVIYTEDEQMSNGYIWRRPSHPDKFMADASCVHVQGSEGPYFDDPIVAAIWIKTELGL